MDPAHAHTRLAESYNRAVRARLRMSRLVRAQLSRYRGSSRRRALGLTRKGVIGGELRCRVTSTLLGSLLRCKGILYRAVRGSSSTSTGSRLSTSFNSLLDNLDVLCLLVSYHVQYCTALYIDLLRIEQLDAPDLC